jgi:hypothetical protein
MAATHLVIRALLLSPQAMGYPESGGSYAIGDFASKKLTMAIAK